MGETTLLSSWALRLRVVSHVAAASKSRDVILRLYYTCATQRSVLYLRSARVHMMRFYYFASTISCQIVHGTISTQNSKSVSGFAACLAAGCARKRLQAVCLSVIPVLSGCNLLVSQPALAIWFGSPANHIKADGSPQQSQAIRPRRGSWLRSASRQFQLPTAVSPLRPHTRCLFAMRYLLVTSLHACM